jgi:bifunctional UDP-N-acetylglucosamine pyrophosphorylase/glucosamine-1-phosphate N-acetyltransferase
MKAVILAAGKGTRLHPLTLSRPKHLVPIGGKPIIDYGLEALKSAGFKEVVMVVNYLSEHFKQYLGDGTRFGIKIEYVIQKRQNGTADATGYAESLVEGPFLLTYGDWLMSPDAISTVISTHEKEQPSVTMAVVNVQNPEHYGVVKVENSKIKEIVEKPSRDRAPSNLANAGMYILPLEIFDAIRQTTSSSRGEKELTDSLSLLLKKGRTILAAPLQETDAFDVGLLWDLFPANCWVLQRAKLRTEGKIENGANLIGPMILEKGSRIRSGTYIEGPAFIGKDSDIGPNCFIRSYTSIGKEARVGNACEIKNSIIMDKTHIGHLSYVGDSLIGENCNLGAGTTIANYRFDGKPIEMNVKDKSRDTGRRKLGIVMGDNVKTGINVSFMPGIKIGPNSWIGPNVLVTRDIPANSKVFLKQNHVNKTEHAKK